MAKINLLSDKLINRIAAGEVVERPASVLKELVENSVDAGAKRIEVGIAKGGKDLITVKDNGEGMVKDDLILSVERHATSKIKSVSDLENLISLGFRGEALASIAAVSKLEIFSKYSGSSAGNKILIEGGRIKFVGEAGAAQGTFVKVNNLFYNVPARRKFLKTDATEEYWCERTIAEYILSHEDIFFKFVKDGKVIYTFSEKDSLKYKASKLLLKEFAAESQIVNFSSGEIKISGLAGDPQLNRANRYYQFFFVNGRPVRSSLLSYAFSEAYGSSIPERRFPACALLIYLPPNSFDVNVHPSKREIKFKEEKKIKALINAAVRQTIGVFKKALDVSEVHADAYKPEKSKDIKEMQYVKEEQPGFVSLYGASPDLSGIIGQYAKTYIILEENNELFLVDQHAAQERINYEKLLGSISDGKPSVQYLLKPVIVELNRAGSEKITEIIDVMKSYGFDIELFGKDSFKIGGVPSFLPEFDVEKTINELADMLIREKRADINKKADEIAKMLSCRRSIKAGDKLDSLGMRAIIQDLSKVKYPQTCPHGRPVKIKIEKALIEKWFRRDYKG